MPVAVDAISAKRVKMAFLEIIDFFLRNPLRGPFIAL